MKKIYILAHDKHRDQDIKINLCGGREDDDMQWIDSFSSNYASGRMPILIEALTREDPLPGRWSDLENIRLIVEDEK